MEKKGIKISKKLSHLSYKIIGTQNTYKLKYFHNRKRFPNFTKPKDLSERILSQMLSPDFLLLADYVDKVKVRDYVKSKGLEKILLKHYGIWDKPEDIDFTSLPNKFILKTNNGSGNHVICYDKEKLDKNEAIKQLNESLAKGTSANELQYRKIIPKIFCEELIDLGHGKLPIDYKFTCINGIPYDIFVASEREKNTRYCTLDMDWNILPYTKKEYLPDTLPQKPKKLDEMISYAKILSQDFSFVRVDFYEYKGNIFFSELTFSPWGGLMYSYTDEAIKILGEKFEIK